MSNQNEPTQSGALPSVPLQPVVGTPRSDEACEDAEVWASRNPKGRVVPYRLAARLEREIADAIAERDSETRWADKYAAESYRLEMVCQSAHDRLLRGDSDKELLAILEEAWKGRSVDSDDRRARTSNAHLSGGTPSAPSDCSQGD